MAVATMSGATLGNGVLVLSAWLHHALGNTLSQIVEFFNFHPRMPLLNSLGDCWVMQFGCGDDERNFRPKRRLRVAAD